MIRAREAKELTQGFWHKQAKEYLVEVEKLIREECMRGKDEVFVLPPPPKALKEVRATLKDGGFKVKNTPMEYEGPPQLHIFW